MYNSQKVGRKELGGSKKASAGVRGKRCRLVGGSWKGQGQTWLRTCLKQPYGFLSLCPLPGLPFLPLVHSHSPSKAQLFVQPSSIPILAWLRAPLNVDFISTYNNNLFFI